MFQLQSPQRNRPFLHQQKIPRVRLSSLESIVQLQREYKNQQIIETIREKLDKEIIGSNAGFFGPFGWRRYTYVDHTASGKAVKCIEKFVENHVLPHYANTHTIVSHTSLQMTAFRNEAREVIKQSVGALDSDKVIFCGSGATAAVHKLLHAINHSTTKKLIVFVGPFEHHSNILPWREAGSKVTQVPLCPWTGQVDMSFLRQNLQRLQAKQKKNQLVVGCFSAGSNITGAVSDDIEITKLLHEFGAVAFWDYAASAPHAEIKMNPKCGKGKEEETNYKNNRNAAFKDAIFFSGHKFLGGPSTPGVLVVKQHVLQNPIPHGMGGGTVLFTTKRGHQYLEDPEEREEGGTPDIIGSIRLGLVFRLRNLVGVQNIIEMEAALCRQVLNEWSQVPEIHILGYNSDLPRLPCISFMIQHLPSGYFLHHNFVVALLNDLFGIQCRGGCMCAGPYAQVLLGIDDNLAGSDEACLKNENKSESMLLKPGFVRISLSFHSSVEEIELVIKAVKFIARHGWKLLPYYIIDWETASFIFTGNFRNNCITSLSSLDQTVASSINLLSQAPPKYINKTVPNPADTSKSQYFQQAKHLLSSVHTNFTRPTLQDLAFLNSLQTKKHLQKLRWFMLSSESMNLQKYYAQTQPSYPFIIPHSLKSSIPFQPVTFNSFNTQSDYLQKKPHHQHTNSILGQLSQAWKRNARFHFTQLRDNTEGSSECEFNPLDVKSVHFYTPKEQTKEKDATSLWNRNRRESTYSSGFEDDDEITDTEMLN